ncbi:MAG: bifunctional 4-hydroxy-2-oxoglutarate aldolase/2-dehydro-3-deoxy-phosphogluconate aldolase [Chloroflexi bacterium AL-W]|nr:bifunctional 4-hydroxy-2-oxoglutarate aldolase/2-dehydro-3-deoxy-phosphogluconate aldolase [Chloroflexi bacterium AL-N1]NOK68902.1 bifunctional 4-hydroxy-2-oxoglutarate aldolase/2-dehydro-3-deoxy-phosphogluconate aldolase [Chloroflexi bacterium AL-N10]NOK76885.1 bifunctional 4-hydroxy-2-oxoglutarate aldolase/2-dehydro-3-deoxy-phosphogluconate aldolase [Chloroflexi bacterium AL-N5]NOK82727.1 bifunctional 4-hydroxy-2-oxoglutarate aldolase/2-dehydro-3-deoxy-phosphogluconate aldolase [Chloroflexi
MSAILDAILTTRVIAIVRLERYDYAVEVARALVEGGVSSVEFTLTGEGANEGISAARTALGDQAQIGVGTVLSPADAEAAIAAGAQFVVTPVVRPHVIEVCRKHNVPILCGALTPTEALTAHEAGADMIKIFPARFGGPSYLRDILAPLPQLRLAPTGGISSKNMREYFDAGAMAVGIGGNLVSPHAVAQENWMHITTAAQACAVAIKGF